MNSAELFVILLVALIVFGPKKLPLLATHLGKMMRHLALLKKKANLFIDAQTSELKLWENKQKAEQADESYKSKL